MERMTVDPIATPETSAGNSKHPGSNAGPLGQSAINYLESLFSASNPDRKAVHDAVHALSSDDLVAYGLNAYRMNLLSLFSEKWAYEKIEATARQAAICKIWRGWEHHRYLAQLTSHHGTTQLQHLPIETIKDLLAQGRGLVLVSFHQGHYRYLPTEIARANIPFCLALATDAFADYRKSRSQSPDAALWKYMTFVNVEEVKGPLHLARTLAKGGTILTALDGNTGIDGPRGADARITVDILTCKAQVKTGAIKLAARFGAPVMILSALEKAGEKLVHTGPVIDPGRPLRGRDADIFVEQAIKASYAHFADNVLHHAFEWGGGDLFHQWRIPKKASIRPPDETENMLTTLLAQGRSIKRNTRRIVETRKAGEILWIDAHTLQCFRIPDNMHPFIKHLSPGGRGIDQRWIDRQMREDRTRVHMFLRKFASIDAIGAA